jgi:hypothetical protein
MQKQYFHYTGLHTWMNVVMSVVALSSTSIASADAISPALTLGNEDTSFVFMGTCPNGAMYRLKAYEKWVDGTALSFYDYEGPAGQGTIHTKTPPKTIAARVCRALAEIRNDS